MPQFRSLASDDWPMLRHIRLTALHESPGSFLATHDREYHYNECQWRAEFSRGDWTVGMLDGRPVSLVGTTREPHTPRHECFIEYVWVAPKCRRSGMASTMLTGIIDRLRGEDVSTAFLWVLDGNQVARSLYKQLGFVSTNLRQPLADDPARSEELLKLDLPGPAT